MKFLDLTPAEPAANLALDEALLEACEEKGGEEVLRFWEPQTHFVVVGYANKIEEEVYAEACAKQQIPVLRRCSGGGTVLQGPGCLNYSLVLKISDALAGIPQTNTYIMERNRDALRKVSGELVEIRGHTDLAISDLKCSGNAQRRKRNCLIFHGTFLLNFDLERVSRLLRFPSKQPDYRQDRAHEGFLTNLNIPAAEVKAALKDMWNAHERLLYVPDYGDILQQKYRREEWNRKF